MATGSPERRIGAFPHVQMPLAWLTEGKLPPVCVYSGQPTGGHQERIEVDLLDLPPDAAPSSPGIRSLMGFRRLAIRLPMAPGFRSAVRRRLWLIYAGFVLCPTIALFAGTEVLGWHTGAVLASLGLMLAIGILGGAFHTVREYGILASVDGTVKLRVPNREAARAYRGALESAGAASPRSCRRCGTASKGPDDGAGDDLLWFCGPCSREPASAGGPRNRSTWLLLPLTLVILLFVLPYVVMKGALSRMFQGLADFAAACALLAGIAAGIPFWNEGGRWVAGGMALALTGAAALWSRGPGMEMTRKAVYFAIGVDLLALLVLVAGRIART